MSRKNILILLGVIALIHIVLISCFVKSSTPSGKNKKHEGKKAAAESGKSIRQDKKRQDIPERAAVVPVKPWKYGRKTDLPSRLQKMASRAKSGILVEYSTRNVIWEKNSRKKVAVASLTKLMSAVLISEKLAKDPQFTMNKVVTVTDAAASVERSRVLGLKKDEKLTVRDLLLAMMIGSYNDATSQLAAEVSGSVPAFVRDMNRRAAAMKLEYSSFNSPNGLPQGRQRVNSFSSAGDILHLCETVMRSPEILPICSMSFAELSSGRKVWTSNNLLLHPTKSRPHRKKVSGLIGFKTGFTNAAGCCLAFGVKRSDRIIIGCVTGFPSAADRDRFCIELIEWAYKQPRR